MKPPCLSVIIPVYNVELYLAAAIESVLKQSMNDFELILVDDGSTDGSAQICDKYAQSDVHRVRTIHLANQGVSAARNRGVSEAKGDYVYFMDADDVLSTTEAFSAFKTSAEMNPNADLIISGYITKKIEDGNCREESLSYPAKFYDWRKEQEDFLGLFPMGFMFVVWNKMFKRELILSNDLHFRLKTMEDFAFVLDYLRVSQNVYVIDRELYVYNVRTNRVGLARSERDGMLEDYKSVHRLFLSMFNDENAESIDRVMFPQYYALILRAISTKSSKIDLKEVVEDEMVKRALQSYEPKTVSEWILFNLVKRKRVVMCRMYCAIRNIILRVAR